MAGEHVGKRVNRPTKKGVQKVLIERHDPVNSR
jgi:hypothetical protein